MIKFIFLCPYFVNNQYSTNQWSIYIQFLNCSIFLINPESLDFQKLNIQN